ncbi:MAG: OmpA family protein [Flavobacteriales bacterium]|nr:OmpA family protein [Flavobacteriales bacterium]
MKKITSLFILTFLLGAILIPNKIQAQMPGSLVPLFLVKGATGHLGENDDSDGDGVKDAADPCPNIWGKMNGCPWKDTDGDGLSDIEDGCPEVRGLKEHNGCPDTDGDGVADNEDSCPEIKGLKELGGCPDTDGDGVADKNDSCPKEKGLKELSGCPDSDGDGIADKDDTCPKIKGSSALNGCPDKDNDGVADNEDVCPDVAGLVANKGCPEVKAAELKVFEKALNGVKFQSGRDRLTTSSYPILNQVVDIMKNNSSYNLKIDGHTDSSGDDTKNLELSKKRAKAVETYLVKKGIEEKRLKSNGFGETVPVADNKTSKGRALNRRVELKVEFTKLVK